MLAASRHAQPAQELPPGRGRSAILNGTARWSSRREPNTELFTGRAAARLHTSSQSSVETSGRKLSHLTSNAHPAAGIGPTSESLGRSATGGRLTLSLRRASEGPIEVDRRGERSGHTKKRGVGG
jgi:hypothetical protein